MMSQNRLILYFEGLSKIWDIKFTGLGERCGETVVLLRTVTVHRLVLLQSIKQNDSYRKHMVSVLVAQCVKQSAICVLNLLIEPHF